jgi:flagellar protein FliT
MPLHLVSAVDYSGTAGIMQVRRLQRDLTQALANEDWAMLRRLNKACALLMDKLITANKNNNSALVLAMRELKDVYACLLRSACFV